MISVALTLAIRIVTIPLTGGVSGSGEAADSGGGHDDDDVQQMYYWWCP